MTPAAAVASEAPEITPERTLFLSRLAGLLAGGHGSVPAVLLLSPDGLEDVAIELGQEGVDEVLLMLRRRIDSVTGGDDLVALVGEDRFAVACAGGESQAMRYATLLEEAFRIPVHVDEHRLVICASIGIAASPGATAESLLRDGRAALRAARLQGGRCHVLHRPELAETLGRRLRIEDELRLALERNEFTLVYQPIVALPSGDIEGLEALIRWNHPQRGLLPPGEFLPVAEESGLIGDIGLWALRDACRQAARWQHATDLVDAYISVNVSARQIASDCFAGQVRDILAQTGVRPERLVLELTESVLMQNANSPTRVLQALREEGVRVALDDFGTGFSSLAYLRTFPIEILKIDRSFVAELPACKTTGRIVASIAQLAANLDLRLVAEGIETVQQAAQMIEVGCEVGQGYLFSRPVPADAAERLLRQGLPRDVLSALTASPSVTPAPAVDDGAAQLTLSEACRVLGVSANTLRRWADSGRISCVKTEGGHRRFSELAVRSLSRSRGHRPVLRSLTAPREAIATAAATLDLVGRDITRAAIQSLYVEGSAGWLASERGAAAVAQWAAAVRASCLSGTPWPAEAATDALVREASLCGTSVLERHLLIERFFDFLMREMAARSAAATELRLLRRLGAALRQRALTACENLQS